MTATYYNRDSSGNVISQVLPLYRLLSSAIGAMKRCKANGNNYGSKWQRLLDNVEHNLLPSGSGIDSGTQIDYEKSGDDKLVLKCNFHHMNDGGYYDGWTEHTITVSPTFTDIDIKISGRDRNEIKDYLADIFRTCLCQLVERGADDVRVYDDLKGPQAPFAASQN